MRRGAGFKPHYLRGSAKTVVPRHCLFFDTETYPVDVEDGWQQQTLKLGWAVYHDTKQGTEVRHLFTEVTGFWDFVETRAYRGSVLWVFAHNVMFDMMVVAWERELRTRGWRQQGNMCVGGPTAIDWVQDDRKIKIVDSMNWFTSSLAQLGESLGYPKLTWDHDSTAEVIEGSAEWELLSEYCWVDVEILMKAMLSWFKIVKDNALGKFRISAAGQALEGYKSSYMDHDIFIHDNPVALELERRSYAGGLTQMWFKGEQRDVTALDVTSMYPSVMRDEVFPTILIAVRNVDWPDEVSIPQLARYVKEVEGVRCFIAEVEITDPAGLELAPYRDERLEYPAGRFRTVLTTPELVACLEAGIVTWLGRVAEYQAAPIFRRWVESIFELRMRYAREGNKVLANLVKIGLLNSLYGKFGQYNHVWNEVPGDWPLEEFTVDGRLADSVMLPDGREIRIRHLGEHVEVRSDERVEGNDSFCAIASHVTAWARRKLLAYRDVCGKENVYYGDTDSLFVNKAGLGRARLAGIVSDTKDKLEDLGTLNFGADDCYAVVVFYGLKAYSKDGSWKLKGASRNASGGIDWVGDGVVEVLNFRGIMGGIRAGDVNRQLTRRGEKRFACVAEPENSLTYLKGVDRGDGWMIPNTIGA